MASKNYALAGLAGNVELGKGGPHFKANGQVIEFVDNADVLTIIRAADPVDDTDVVTKGYLDKHASFVVGTQIWQAAPPAGSFVGEMAICTLTAGAYTIKNLYRWDGAAWVEIVPFGGMRISITVALSGHTDEYLADHIYLYDGEGATWIDVGPSLAPTYIDYNRRVALTIANDGVPANIGSQVNADSIVTKTMVKVSTVFSSDATLEIGDAGDTNRLMDNAELDLNALGVYVVDNYYKYAAATQLIATFAKGTAIAGNCEINLLFSKGA